jgi:hypothetical protein
VCLRYVAHLLVTLNPPFRINLSKMALVACLAVAFRRSGTSTVTAFSLATTLSASRVAASKAFHSAPLPRAFLNQQFRTSTASAITALRQSAVATANKLEQSLDVTHPAFEVVKKDVVSEYGAYCTLYRHKKSGAELLSVAIDDDNKVRNIVAL